MADLMPREIEIRRVRRVRGVKRLHDEIILGKFGARIATVLYALVLQYMGQCTAWQPGPGVIALPWSSNELIVWAVALSNP